MYGGIYFFDSPVYKKAGFQYIELTKIFRQKDANFINVLNIIRNKDTKKLNYALVSLNTRHLENFNYAGRMTLCAHNDTAAGINKQQMEALETRPYRYVAVIHGRFSVEKKDYPADKILTLKSGSLIMMLKNDKDGRFVNGTLGTVESLSENEIHVSVDGFTFPVEKATWEAIEYTYDRRARKITSEVTGSFEQYPIKLAWAISIHKSQGQTFDAVNIEMDNVFASGQTYVALSRCKTLEGIRLKRKLRPGDIQIDPRIVNFYKKHFTEPERDYGKEWDDEDNDEGDYDEIRDYEEADSKNGDYGGKEWDDEEGDYDDFGKYVPF